MITDREIEEAALEAYQYTYSASGTNIGENCVDAFTAGAHFAQDKLLSQCAELKSTIIMLQERGIKLGQDLKVAREALESIAYSQEGEEEWTPARDSMESTIKAREALKQIGEKE